MRAESPLRGPASTLCYLQTAEDGEKVVEGHHVAVDCHEAEQPGGADEQQEEEGHPECRAEE